VTGYPDGAEYRDIQVVAIEMRNPLKVTLSLLAIPPEAVHAFQDICRSVILFREGRSSRPGTAAAGRDGVTEQEAQRLQTHISMLQHAQVPLKRVSVKQQ
jgi:hypothetical protein